MLERITPKKSLPRIVLYSSLAGLVFGNCPSVEYDDIPLSEQSSSAAPSFLVTCASSHSLIASTAGKDTVGRDTLSYTYSIEPPKGYASKHPIYAFEEVQQPSLPGGYSILVQQTGTPFHGVNLADSLRVTAGFVRSTAGPVSEAQVHDYLASGASSAGSNPSAAECPTLIATT